MKTDRSLPVSVGYLNVRHKGVVTHIPQSEILYIEGNGPYSTVYTKDESFTTARTLKKIAGELDASFIRVHKTYLVNSTFIKGHNKLKLLLTNNKSLPVSRSGSKNIDSLYSS